MMDKCCFFVAFSEQLKLHPQLETSLGNEVSFPLAIQIGVGEVYILLSKWA
jgi:hypothetical protein